MASLNWIGKTTEESVAIKVYGYLLDPEHVNLRGHLTGKAMWFKNNLGFTRYNASALIKQIKFNRLRAELDKFTEFGQKYREIIKILGANGKSKYIEFVWIENLDGVIRLVTIKGFQNMKKMISLFDTVKLKKDLLNISDSDRGLVNLPAGSFGTIVMVFDESIGNYDKPVAYEVDFCDSTGDTVALLTLDPDDIELYRRYKKKVG